MEFDSDINEIVFVGPLMEIDDRNIIEHMTSMASKLPNAHKGMDLIHAWVNNPHIYPTMMIDWLKICVSHK
jgi:hypothetical protein